MACTMHGLHYAGPLMNYSIDNFFAILFADETEADIGTENILNLFHVNY